MGYHSYEDYLHLLENHAISTAKPPVVFLMTGDQKPFCRAHYRITARVSASEDSILHGGEIGTLSVRLHPLNKLKKSTERIKFSDKPKFFEPGFEYTAMVPGKHVVDPTYATVYWEYSTSLLNPLTWRILSAPRIYLDYVIIEALESNHYLKLCPSNDGSIMAGTENVLLAENCKGD